MHDNTRRTEGREGYITEVAYPRNFLHQVSPSVLSLAAALNGSPAPPDEGFDYCEIGCGGGDTLAVLAAANPTARFVGIDLHEGLIASATEGAKSASLSNAQFMAADFEAADALPLPDFDFIVAHGLWTWISPAKQQALLKFASSRLKPGGLFYLSYNALPGWAAIEPLRRLMLEHTVTNTGGPIERARNGVDLARRLLDAGAAYFKEHPTLKQMLGVMEKGGLPYVVHEYFHADWHPMYFTDVAAMLRESGLTFLGQVPLYLNVKELALPPSLKQFAETTDRLALESLKDFANNEFFRSDIYVKGAVTRSPQESQYFFESTPFGTTAPLSHVRREARLPHHTLKFTGPVYDAVLGAIAASPASAMGMALRPELAAIGQTRIGHCLRNLTLGEQVLPMRPEQSAGPRKGRFTIPSRFNETAVARALAGNGLPVLASAVTGRGVQLSPIELLSLHLVTSVPEADRTAWLTDYATRRETPFASAEGTSREKGEFVRAALKEVARFHAVTADQLLRFGIIETVT